MSSVVTSRAISAENQFTDPMPMHGKGIATILVQGTLSATVRMQIRPLKDVAGVAWASGAAGWSDPANSSLTAVGDKTIGPFGGEWEVRAGTKTGEFSSATDLKVFLGVSNG